MAHRLLNVPIPSLGAEAGDYLVDTDDPDFPVTIVRYLSRERVEDARWVLNHLDALGDDLLPGALRIIR